MTGPQGSSNALLWRALDVLERLIEKVSSDEEMAQMAIYLADDEEEEEEDDDE